MNTSVANFSSVLVFVGSVQHQKQPYRSPDDGYVISYTCCSLASFLLLLALNNYMLCVIQKKKFLGYLDAWNRSVEAREGFTPAQKQMMQVLQETLVGLRMTG